MFVNCENVTLKEIREMVDFIHFDVYIGKLDDDGFLTITDRLKNIIVLSNGKNIAPQPIEQKLCHSPYISDCILIGDDQKVIGALIIPQKEYLTDFAKFNNIEFRFIFLFTFWF